MTNYSYKCKYKNPFFYIIMGYLLWQLANTYI